MVREWLTKKIGFDTFFLSINLNIYISICLLKLHSKITNIKYKLYDLGELNIGIQRFFQSFNTYVCQVWYLERIITNVSRQKNKTYRLWPRPTTTNVSCVVRMEPRSLVSYRQYTIWSDYEGSIVAQVADLCQKILRWWRKISSIKISPKKNIRL